MIKKIRRDTESRISECLPNILFDLHERCADAPAGAEQELIGRLISIAARTAAGSSRVLAASLDIDRLRSWVMENACLTSVSALVSHRTGYMLSRAPDGASLATVVVEGQLGEHSCFGRTEALALCGAVSAALLAQLTAEPTGPEMLLH